MTNEKKFSVQLFYSYCHANAHYRVSMEKALSNLGRGGLLIEWSDQNILPGQRISKEIKKKMDESDIIVFLFSRDFIASDECMKEWEYAKGLVANNTSLFLIPIILEKCAWPDVLGDDDFKALPTDGNPVSGSSPDEAWQNVYEGIKDVISQLRKNFAPRQKFLKEMENTEFVAQQKIRLQDIFVFLRLSCYAPQTQDSQVLEETIEDERQLLEKDYTLIHGEKMSGKTALARYLFLYLSGASKAVLYIDLEEFSGKPNEQTFAKHIRINLTATIPYGENKVTRRS